MQLVQTLDRTPFDYEELSVGTGAVLMLDDELVAEASAILLTVEGHNIRYRIDGGNPDANTGHPVYATQNLYFVNKASMRNLRMIGLVGTAEVKVTYYR